MKNSSAGKLLLNPGEELIVQIGPGVPDVTVQFTGRVGSNGWLIKSDDPILAEVVPLPNSFYMAAAGLLGLAYHTYRRTRKNA